MAWDPDKMYRLKMPMKAMFKNVITIEKLPLDNCRICQKLVEFVTDGDGHLVALDDDGRKHPCGEAT